MGTFTQQQDKAINWRLADLGQLLWADWGEDTVVFNGLSADTHLLNTMSLDVLLLLAKKPMSAEQLIMSLANQWQQPSEQIAKPISSLIHNLDCLGLIEPEFT
ncbi:HPr-rel-A system PqqD family peptide chaperone [Endozoicomonas sp. SM1973]|uniref:HPr-rel-A system PqqD family peptide chaperone n=1 Tax=Spartinivicinus marinus TaxID=2994442 RepID=A0A853IHL1_9GAMM|nr:HPr-rel-A system PqqD family peptide chaperone [Spartinivicinus marinus]MCX4025344.1 HPr-rel-A system PqqD family peptide chaperone [Spartinivicinus marinus]NYZ68917.1 HPr-rel-A system PqqD family peptide chaperone [Spartinivicinus marinus]